MQIVKSNSSLREPDNDLLAIKMVWGQSSYIQFWFSVFQFCVIPHMLTHCIFRKMLNIFLKFFGKIFWKNFLEIIFKNLILDAKWRFLTFEKKIITSYFIIFINLSNASSWAVWCKFKLQITKTVYLRIVFISFLQPKCHY